VKEEMIRIFEKREHEMAEYSTLGTLKAH